MDILRKRWLRLMRRLHIGPALAVKLFAELQRRYTEGERHYHTLDGHIGECLREFDTVRHKAADPLAVETSLFCHDMCHDEITSARWIASTLRQANVPPTFVKRVSKLILATTHKDIPSDPDAMLVVDLDLAILGRPTRRFREYCAGIRKEYAHIPLTLYRQRRVEILQRFLARPRIYSTSYLFERFEKQARKNLRNEINLLKNSPSQ